MELWGKAEVGGPGCEQFHRELGGKSELQREAQKQRFRAWLLTGFPAVLRPAVHAPNSPVVAAGTLSSITGPDHNSLGSVLSAVPRQTTGPGAGQGCSELISPAWCSFPPLCTPALSVSPGLPLPTALTAVRAGSSPEMSGPWRQGSACTQSSLDLSRALRCRACYLEITACCAWEGPWKDSQLPCEKPGHPPASL